MPYPLLTLRTAQIIMLTGTEIKQGLLGSLEMALLMNRAESRFGKTRRAALRSFLVPVYLLPLTGFLLWLFASSDLSGRSLDTFFMLHAGKLALTWIVYFGAMYWLVKRLNRAGYFFRFVSATNWLTVPATVLLLPLLWLSHRGSYGPEEILVLSVILMIYSAVFTAFMIKRVFRLPWELAGAMALFGLFVNHYARDVVDYIGGVI